MEKRKEIKITITRALTLEQYAILKNKFKKQGLGRIRRHTEKYCYGSVDLRPPTKGEWSLEEFEKVKNFITENSLYRNGQMDIIFGENGYYICKSSGIGYLMINKKGD